MIIVFSSEPTQVTKTSHRVTHALFEWIDKKEIEEGVIILPDILIGLNHEGLEITLKQSQKLKLAPKVETDASIVHSIEQRVNFSTDVDIFDEDWVIIEAGVDFEADIEIDYDEWVIVESGISVENR